MPVIGEVLKLKNGQVLERDSIPIKFGEDQMGHLWAYRDVTEEYHLQSRIQESEEKYRGIIENMELGLLEVDLDHKIVRAYDWFCDMTGYTEDELIGKDAREVFLPPEYRDIMDNADAVRSKGKQSIYEVELIRKGGERIWVLISGAPFYDSQGNMVGSIGIHYNITQRKQLERDLDSARIAAETARDAEKQFLAKMSHEIRNPINAIVGLTNLLYDTSLSEQQFQHLNNIKYSADILLGLISEILDLAKIESDSFELNEKEINIKDTMEALIRIIDFKQSSKDVQYSYTIDPKVHQIVRADPTVVNQILLNLLSNAEKFTERGQVSVHCRLLETTGDKVNLGFEVRDTGIGIDGKDYQRIFDSFQQADNETKLKYGGTGLGLSIVKQLVKRYDGEVNVTSLKEQGTTFSFNLWLTKADCTSEVKPDISYQKLSSDIKALIVEDNKINQQYLSGLLRKWAIPYDIADNGRKALDLMQENLYDIILMDIRMPGMDGYEATIRLRSSKDNKNSVVPIIALTASALVDEKERAIAAGMNYHITKPFTPEQLAAALEQFGILKKQVLPSQLDTGEADHDFKFSYNHEFLGDFYEGDLERAKVMFEIFLKTVDKDMESFKTSAEQQDWKTAGEIAHRIKPNFAMVGLLELSEHFKSIDKVRKEPSLGEEIEKELHYLLAKFKKDKKIVEKELEALNTYLKE
jgi:PAS domain S-box-containing protein